MKRILLLNFLKSGNTGRFTGLILCLILSAGLSGQKLQTNLIETWTSGNWLNFAKTTNTYNVSGFLTNTLFQNWDYASSSWENITQSNFTNNPDGTTNQMITQIWDGVSAWSNTIRTTYTYNASKKVLTQVREIWLIAIWQNSSRTTNTYDGSGYLTNGLSQRWDLVSSTWKNDIQTNYTNNPNGTVNQEIDQLWDGVSTWNNTQRSTFTYNGSNKILTDVSDNWTAGNWAPSSRFTNTYNGSGYLTNNLIQSWDAGTSTWKNNLQFNYTNNTDGSPSQGISQLWDGVSVWNNAERFTYTYSSPTLVYELSDEGLVIYPNPGSDLITITGKNIINGSTYSITDLTGKPVLKGKIINENTTLDIKLLPNGIYFLHLGERSQHSYKIIKNQLR